MVRGKGQLTGTRNKLEIGIMATAKTSKTATAKAPKGKKSKVVTILNASTEQRSKWAVNAWKDPELRKRLLSVLKDNAERAKLRNLKANGEINKTQAARLKALEAKVGQKAAAQKAA